MPVGLTDRTLKYVGGLGVAYSVDQSGNALMYYADGLGSVRTLRDTNLSVVESYQTDPFGVATQTQGSVNQPFQYTGEQKDDTGLYYLRARMYDVATGRFLQRDDVFGSPESPGSLHRYAYVENNPATLTDPSGHCPFCPLLQYATALAQRAGPWLGQAGQSVSRYSQVLRGSYQQTAADLFRKGLPEVNELTLTGTNKGHLADVVTRGEYKYWLARPYLRSRLTMQEIMRAGSPVLDPQGTPGVVRWDVPGWFRGSEGTWELVINLKTMQVVHFLFRS